MADFADPRPIALDVELLFVGGVRVGVGEVRDREAGRRRCVA
jgi:hypothetical protein